MFICPPKTINYVLYPNCSITNNSDLSFSTSFMLFVAGELNADLKITEMSVPNLTNLFRF